MHVITAIQPGSVARRHGICPGDEVVSIGGEPLLDEIDYQALTFPAKLEITLRRKSGGERRVLIRKEEGEPLGLRFGESMTLSPRRCRNRCVFCFIDQMPTGLRDTLYVKDDDWRYSLMMGNYVTLTNVEETEFQRMIRRRASPLYVSVHTTEVGLRCRMMGNPRAGDILDRLKRLRDAGIRFHCQIVVCPGYNDEEALLQTLGDLKALAPAALSVALVPVGLTRHREGLTALTPFDEAGAKKLLRDIAPFQEECRREIHTTFAFPSDEFFCMAKEPIPAEEWYEHYPQIENGVGLLRLLESEMEEAGRFEDKPPDSKPRRLLIVTGVSAAPHIRRLAAKFAPRGTEVEVLAIRNHFFGETVTVAGLLVGGDILAQLPAKPQADRLLLVSSTLRHEGDRFLDDMTLETFKARAPLPVAVIGPGGQDLYDALRGE